MNQNKSNKEISQNFRDQKLQVSIFITATQILTANLMELLE